MADADVDLLQSLAEKSLIRQLDGRIWMLETIRAYAAERLADSGEAVAFGRRHLDWVVSLATRLSLAAPRAELERWSKEVTGEEDNVRAALDFASEARLAEREAAMTLDEAVEYAVATRGNSSKRSNVDRREDRRTDGASRPESA